MKERITLQKLKDLGACPEAIAYAAERFNGNANGVSASEFLRQIPRGDWLIWWIWNSGTATLEQCILLGCVAGRRSLRFALEQDRAVLVAAFDAAEVVVAKNTEATRSAAWSAWSAASAASAAASAALESAVESVAWSVALSAEQLACVGDMRAAMKIMRYQMAGGAVGGAK